MDRPLDMQQFGDRWPGEASRASYIDSIQQADAPEQVVRLVDEFFADLHRDGTLPEVPAPVRPMRVASLDDAYCWLGMLTSKIQRHAVRLPADTLLAIHAVLDTAFSRFSALGLK